jgi:signal transduction histidine kinase
MTDLHWSYITAGIYWLLVLCWAAIAYSCAREYPSFRRINPLVGVLVLIILVDGARTLVESVYFAIWYTGRTPLLPLSIHTQLSEPQILLLPKLVNLAAAALILVLLARRWLPNIQKELEHHRQVQRLYGELRMAEAARENLSRMLVHDMRVPLTNLLTGLRTAQTLEDPLARQEINEVAIRGGERLLHMINELLDTQRLEHGDLPLQRARVPAARIVEEALAEVSEIAGDRGVRLEQSASELAMDVDPSLLRRVLVNLLANAIRFSPPGGTVTISAVLAGGTACLSVTDQGPGVPEEERERIFEPFYQLDLPGAGRVGSGLGLAFCRLAVDAHGGTIRIDPVPGAGSRFTVVLPVTAETAATEAALASV